MSEQGDVEHARASLDVLVHQWEEARPELDLSAFRLVAAVMQLAQVFESEFRVLAQAEFGIGTGDLRVLLALRRAGQPYMLRPTDLFQSLLVSSGAVTKQVDRLEELGYVERVLPEGARRRRVIALTKKGVKVADRAQDVIATSLAGVGPTLAQMPRRNVDIMLKSLAQLVVAATPPQGPGGEADDE